jgi:hypothetical protein
MTECHVLSLESTFISMDLVMYVDKAFLREPY